MGNLSSLSGDLTGVADDLRANLNNALRVVDSIPVRKTAASAGDIRPAGVNAAYVRTMIAERRQRDEFFPENLFADPAWDMLLELYAASLDQQRLSITNLCVSAAVPPTTALRWIGTLEATGLATRRSDPLDARRVFMSLSATGQEAMEAYFRSLMRPSAKGLQTG